MKHGKRVRRDESPSDNIIARAGRASAYLFFFLPFFFLATSFLPIFCIDKRGLKSSEATKKRPFYDLYKNGRMGNAHRNRFGVRSHHAIRGSSGVRRRRDRKFLRSSSFSTSRCDAYREGRAQLDDQITRPPSSRKDCDYCETSRRNPRVAHRETGFRFRDDQIVRYRECNARVASVRRTSDLRHLAKRSRKLGNHAEY